MQTDIKKNINNVLNSINSSCQQANINANKVLLIAVSKRKSIENIQNAMDIGIKNFGENYAQELNEKISSPPTSSVLDFILLSNTLIIIFFTLLNCSWLETKINFGAQSLIIYS